MASQQSVALAVFFISSLIPILGLDDCSCNLDTPFRTARNQFIENKAKSYIRDYTTDRTSYILQNTVQSSTTTKSFNLTAFLANYSDNIADFVLKGGLFNITWSDVTDKTLKIKRFGIFGVEWQQDLPAFLKDYSDNINENLRDTAHDRNYPLGVYRGYSSRSYGYSCLRENSNTPSLCNRRPWNWNGMHRVEIALLPKDRLQLTWNSQYDRWTRPYSVLFVTDVELAADTYFSAIYNKSYIQSTFDRCTVSDCRYFNMTLYFAIPCDSSAFQRLNTSLYELRNLHLRFLNTTLDLVPQPLILRCFKGDLWERCYYNQNGASSNNTSGAGSVNNDTAEMVSDVSGPVSEYTQENTNPMDYSVMTTDVSSLVTESISNQTDTSDDTEETSTDGVTSAIDSSSTSSQFQHTGNPPSPEANSTTQSTFSTVAEISTASSLATITDSSLTIATGTFNPTSNSSHSLNSNHSSTVTTSTVSNPAVTYITTNPFTARDITSAVVSSSSSSTFGTTSSCNTSSGAEISSQTTGQPNEPVASKVPNPYFALANITSFPVFEDDPTFYAKVPVIKKVYNDDVLLKRFQPFKIFVSMSSYFYTITIPVALVVLAVVSVCLCLLQKDWLHHGNAAQNADTPELKKF